MNLFKERVSVEDELTATEVGGKIFEKNEKNGARKEKAKNRRLEAETRPK